MTRIMCSWCDSFNTVGGPTRCEACGHNAFQPRLLCDCPRCSLARRRAAAPDAPAPIAPAITEALNRLRHEAAQDEGPADRTDTPDGGSDMPRKPSKIAAPVTRELKLTPVSPALAAAIRAMDELLLAELGYDFAYAVLGKGNLIAASNAKDGVVPPVVAKAAPDVGS